MMSEGWKVLYLHTEDPRLHEDLPCGPRIDQRSGSHKKVSSRDSAVTRGLSSFWVVYLIFVELWNTGQEVDALRRLKSGNRMHQYILFIFQGERQSSMCHRLMTSVYVVVEKAGLMNFASVPRGLPEVKETQTPLHSSLPTLSIRQFEWKGLANGQLVYEPFPSHKETLTFYSTCNPETAPRPSNSQTSSIRIRTLHRCRDCLAARTTSKQLFEANIHL